MRTLTLTMAALVSVLGLSFSAQADPTVDLLIGGANSVDASAGGTVTVDVVLTLAGGDLTDGYQLTVFWDTTELAYNGGSLANGGPAGVAGWTPSGFGEIFLLPDRIAGSISAIGPAIGAGTYNLGSLSFTVLAGVTTDGTNDITVGLDPVTTFSTDFIGNGAGGSYAATVFNGAGVNVVPEPTTASLLGLGLLGLTIAGRRRER